MPLVVTEVLAILGQPYNNNSGSDAFVVGSNDTSNLTDWQGDEEVNKLSLLVLYGVCIPLVAVLGVLLNAASLVVLTRPPMRSSVNVYLAGLSLFDCLLLLVALLIFPPFSYCEYFPETGFWCQHVIHTFQITYPVMNIMQTGSIWTVTAMTVDRFLAIIYPLKSRKYLTIGRATFILVCVLVWSVVYNIPSFFELEHVNGTLQSSELRKNQLYISIYKSYCYLFLMFLIPAILMIVMNSMVTVAVRRAYKMRKQMCGKEEKERRSTIMAVLVVCCFLVLNLTSNVTNIVEAFSSAASASYALMVWTGNLLVTVNSTINFFIYCALSLRFRQMFCRLFCRPFCYTPDQEYRHLSQYFRRMRPGGLEVDATRGSARVGGIISMRSLRKPLVRQPGVREHEERPRRFTIDHQTLGEGNG